MSASYDYIRDGAEIYRRSFAIIRDEADLTRFTPDEARVVVRIIHACGMVEIAYELVFAPDFTAALSRIRRALQRPPCGRKNQRRRNSNQKDTTVANYI